ncbi:uncharacterized protein LOC123513282 [Portunus trituberculatus]|uniref:uncharacterized protein LOC123513282 n=1 Tax=Portunus trituberculatus TaxID=210409 RepID=UPI001E1D1F6C|nr:uncharacterized protein LOC123513282 [Portunus trituberculatus]XP_045126293.1 uncharacterized protein LOC123513282 [Portunus trituberculatus]XP_045126294.1 uncharacterized protein LOC123513282 [Portunus trituberculatus]
MEKNQHTQLQQQLQTVLHRKEEAQNLTQKVKANLERESPLAEIAQRALAENAEKLAKINEEVVKIRREAIDLVQAHQIINELQRQVDASCNRVTTLEEKKTLARGRMRSLLAEETILSQNMKASVTKVCAEQKEHAVEMNEKFHILWSNVELLLGCCDMLLKLTRPEVEALKLDGHQADASNRIQTVSSHSQVEIRDDHSQVVSAEAQADISQVHSLGQDVTQHEDFSQRVDSLASSLTERDHKNHILSVGGDNQLDGGNTEVFLEPIADEDQHERDTVTDKQDIENHILSVVDGNQFDGENTEICLEAIADEDQRERDAVTDKQEMELFEVQSVEKQTEIQIEHPLLNQTELDLNTELLHESPSAVLTQNERSYKAAENLPSSESNQKDVTATSEIQLEHDILHTDTSVNFAEVQCSPCYSGNEKCFLTNKDLLDTDGAFQSSLSSSIASQNNQPIANAATPQVCNTVSTCTLTSNFSQPYISHVSASSSLKTFAVSQIESRTSDENTISTHTEEKQVEESSALAHEVMEIDASMKQIEDSTQQEKSDSSSAYQGKCILNSSAILSAEEDSSHNTALNNNSPATQTPITTVVMTAEDIPLTNKLSTTAPLHFSQTGGNIVMPSEKQLQDVEVPDLDKQISCNISSASLVSEQTDKQPTGSVSQVKEHESLSNYSSQQDKS